MIQQRDLFVLPGFRLLPGSMYSTEAVAMLLAIGAQESRFTHRAQVPVPHARGFWQFERSGVSGVLSHPASRTTAEQACSLMRYTSDVPTVYAAIQHNDALACAFARLALWRLPAPLCGPDDAEGAWSQYVEAWRPGKPHRHTWDDLYRQAWEAAA